MSDEIVKKNGLCFEDKFFWDDKNESLKLDNKSSN